jgi:hypothetical protein
MNAYKDMLDNVVSPITCVSMNHQNQLEQMANGALFATYYRRFVHDFTSIAAPLHELTKRDVTFAWSDLLEVAFCTLKDKLTHAHLLQLPNLIKCLSLNAMVAILD